MLLCGVSVKSMAVLESDGQLRLLIASSDGYIKLYGFSIKVCNQQNTVIFFAFLAHCSVVLMSVIVTLQSQCINNVIIIGD